MSPFFDDLEAQLRDAARTRSAAQPAPVAPSRRGWLRAGLRSAPVLVAVATTIAVVAAALVLIGHGQRGGPPSGGSPTPPTSVGALFAQPKARLRRELRYIEQATHAMEASPGCHAPPTGRMKTSQGRPSQALTSILGVLSRPATAADRLRLSALSGEPEIVYVNYVRRAMVRAGISYYIVPVRNEPGVGVPTRRCFARAVAALHDELPDIPSALRRPTVALQTRIIGFGSRLDKPQDAICFVTQARNEGGSSCADQPPRSTTGMCCRPTRAPSAAWFPSAWRPSPCATRLPTRSRR